MHATKYTSSQNVYEGQTLVMGKGDSLVYVGSGVAMTVTGAKAVMTGREATFEIGGSTMSIAGGLHALNGGQIELEQGTLSTQHTGQRIYESLLAQGKDQAGRSSKIRLSNVDITPGYNESGHGAFVAREGGSVHFTDGQISAGKRNDFFGLFSVAGKDSEIRAVRTNISLLGRSGVGVSDRGKLVLQSMQISSTDGYLNMLANGAGSQINSVDVTLSNGRYDVVGGASASVVNGTVENDGQSAFRLVGSSEAVSTIKVDKGSYSTRTGYLVDIDHDGRFQASDASFSAQDAWAVFFTGSSSAELSLKKSTIQSAGKDRSHGVEVRGGSATLENSNLETLANAAYGLRGSQSSETLSSLLTLRDSKVSVQGTGGAALYLEGDKVEAVLERSELSTAKANAHGMVQVDRAKLTVSDTNVTVKGAGASAYLSRLTATGSDGNSTTMSSVRMRAEGGPLMWLQGDRHSVSLTESSLVASDAQTKVGELLRVGNTVLPNNASVAAGIIIIEAADTELVGDVRVESDTADVRLRLTGSSRLQAALQSDAGRRVAEFDLLDSTSWQVTGHSGVGRLGLQGTLEFALPATASDFKRLQVGRSYDLDSGIMVFNTQLGGDASPTDLVHVQGDAFGAGKVRVNNVKGEGALTTEGIRLLQVDGESSAKLSLQGRVVAGPYEYVLQQGGVSTPDDGDWYLRSSQPPPKVPDDPVKPDDPSTPVDPTPVDPTPPIPPAPVVPLWRPEVAAYQSNQFAAISLFSHSLHDRLGEPVFAERQRDGQGGHAWVRSQRQQRDTRAADTQLAVASDSSLLQAGAELTRWEQDDQRAHLGVMAGLVQAQSHVGSHLTGYRAKGRLRGHGVGLYGTWYEHAARMGGLYLDAWLQHSRFNNQVLGQGLPVVKYGARSWTASLEAGYAWHWHTSANARWMLEPQLQYTYVQHTADPLREANGTRIDASAGTGIDRRLGVRVYAQALEPQMLRVQPYLGLHREHYAARRGVLLGDRAMPPSAARRLDTVQAGADAELGGGWTARGFISLRHGKGQYREVSGQIGLGYRW